MAYLTGLNLSPLREDARKCAGNWKGTFPGGCYRGKGKAGSRSLDVLSKGRGTKTEQAEKQSAGDARRARIKELKQGVKPRKTNPISYGPVNQRGQGELFDLAKMARPQTLNEMRKRAQMIERVQKKRSALKREIGLNPSGKKTPQKIARLRVLSKQQKSMERQLKGEETPSGALRGTAQARKPISMSAEVESATQRFKRAGKGKPSQFKSGEFTVEAATPKGLVKKKVKGQVIGDYAVEKGGKFVTHVPTGKKTYDAGTTKEALFAAKRLARSGVRAKDEKDVKNLRKLVTVIRGTQKAYMGGKDQSKAKSEEMINYRSFYKPGPDGKPRKFKAAGRRSPERNALARVRKQERLLKKSRALQAKRDEEKKRKKGEEKAAYEERMYRIYLAEKAREARNPRPIYS